MAAQAYLEFAKRAFSREGTYRAEVFTRIGSVLLRVFLLATLWTALYRNNGAQAGIPLHAMITYATLALLLDLIYGVDGAYVIRYKIREGSIAIDFMRPISVPLYVFADTVGQTAFGVLQILPALLLSMALLSTMHVGVDLPVSLAALAAFLISLAFGFLLNFLIDLMMATITFWTMEIFGVQLMVQFIASLLSGSLVPLYFFPTALQKIVFALPFAGLYNTPLSIYIGKYRGGDILTALAEQAAWVAAFAVASAMLWRTAERRVVIQGG